MIGWRLRDPHCRHRQLLVKNFIEDQPCRFSVGTGVRADELLLKRVFLILSVLRMEFGCSGTIFVVDYPVEGVSEMQR